MILCTSAGYAAPKTIHETMLPHVKNKHLAEDSILSFLVDVARICILDSQGRQHTLIKSLASQGLKQIQLGANYSKFIGHSCTSPARVIQTQFLDSSFSCQTIYLQTSSEFPTLCLPLSVSIGETGSFCPICY
jgi:hypothetical protein